jgi:tetratricopeptide (TPR) repeat protein
LNIFSVFLSQLGRNKLKQQLDGAQPADTASSADILAEELAGIPALLVLDDFQRANKEIINLFRSLMPAIAHHNKLKIIILSRKVVKFYDRRDVVLNKSVTELGLSGLDESSSRILLSIPDVSDEEFADIYLRSGGHPLYLELMSTAPGPAGGDIKDKDMFEFMHEEIFSKLSGEEQKLLKMASIYRYPVYAEAFFSDPDISYSHIDDLVARSYLHRRGLNLFDTHDLIRTFFYKRLTGTERKKFHKAAAEFYIQLFSNLNTEDIVDLDSTVLAEALLELQHHLIRSGEQTSALGYTQKYGKKLIDAGRFELLVILDEYELEEIRPIDRARILLQKGEILTHLGDVDEALKALQAGRGEIGSSGRSREKALLSIMIGENHAARGDWAKGGFNYRKALKYLEGKPENKRTKDENYDLARCYNNLGLVLKKTGKTEKALELYMSGLETLEKYELGSVADRAAVMENLGLLFIELNQPEYAHDYFEKAISQLEVAGDNSALAKLLATVGEVYVEQGDIRTATKFFEKGVYFWEQVEDTEHATKIFLRLGQVFAQQITGTTPQSVRAQSSYWERFQRFFSQSEHEDFKKISHLYDRIGSLYMHRGYWHKSLEFHNKALELFKKLNDDRGLAKVYNNLGVLYRSRQEPVFALESYKKAVGYLKNLGERRGLAITYLNIGRLYERLDNAVESKKAYEDCLKEARADESFKRYTALALLGLARQTAKGTTSRTNYLKEAEEIFREQDDTDNLAEVVRLKAEKA